MAYTTDYANAQNGTFLQVIQEAICSTAIAVMAESSGTAFHAQRAVWAVYVLGSPIQAAATMAYGMCADGVITPASTDVQVKNQASAVWNAYAGAT